MTGADSPWNQLANLEVVPSDFSSVFLVLLKVGRKDHFSLVVGIMGDDMGEVSKVTVDVFTKRDGGRVKPFA